MVGADRVDVPGHCHVDLTGVDGRGSSLEDVDPGDGGVYGSIDRKVPLSVIYSESERCPQV